MGARAEIYCGGIARTSATIDIRGQPGQQINSEFIFYIGIVNGTLHIPLSHVNQTLHSGHVVLKVYFETVICDDNNS